MSDSNNTIWCSGCGAEILYIPYVLNQKNYCCQDCALGFACQCGRAMERGDDYRDADLPMESSYSGGQVGE